MPSPSHISDATSPLSTLATPVHSTHSLYRMSSKSKSELTESYPEEDIDNTALTGRHADVARDSNLLCIQLARRTKCGVWNSRAPATLSHRIVFTIIICTCITFPRSHRRRQNSRKLAAVGPSAARAGLAALGLTGGTPHSNSRGPRQC